MIRKLTMIVGTVLALGAGVALAQEALPVQPAQLVREVCANCHGVHGRSVAPTFPNLAGQPAPYIEMQLNQFREHTRADPHARAYMWGIASNMSNAMIKGLAEYFAKQKPAAGTPQNPTLVAAGKEIFMNGDAKQGIPACKTCHGAEGQGLGTFPRLAGQHRDYILAQLVAFQTNTRNNIVMHANVSRMTHDQMEELAAYLASL